MIVENNYDLKNEATFRIGGKVSKAAFPETIEELTNILQDYDIVLGNCSNILFSSNYINQKIIFTKKLNKYKITGDRVYVECGALGPIVAAAVREKSLSGFEFLAGFPGSFGGMIYMNASAHNQAIQDTFVKADLYDCGKNEVRTFIKEDMQFGYRTSILQNNRYILLNAEFKLIKGDKGKITELMERNIAFRKERQPSLKYGNAGSIFRNPKNDSAGRLLDLCNFKGEEENGAKVFDKHANFIINYKDATSKDVLTLMKKMYSKVKEKYTIELEAEIKYIGDKGTEEYELWESMKKNS